MTEAINLVLVLHVPELLDFRIIKSVVTMLPI